MQTHRSKTIKCTKRTQQAYSQCFPYHQCDHCTTIIQHHAVSIKKPKPNETRGKVFESSQENRPKRNTCKKKVKQMAKTNPDCENFLFGHVIRALHRFDVGSYMHVRITNCQRPSQQPVSSDNSTNSINISVRCVCHL